MHCSLHPGKGLKGRLFRTHSRTHSVANEGLIEAFQKGVEPARVSVHHHTQWQVHETMQRWRSAGFEVQEHLTAESWSSPMISLSISAGVCVCLCVSPDMVSKTMTTHTYRDLMVKTEIWRRAALFTLVSIPPFFYLILFSTCGKPPAADGPVRTECLCGPKEE